MGGRVAQCECRRDTSTMKGLQLGVLGYGQMNLLKDRILSKGRGELGRHLMEVPIVIRRMMFLLIRRI